MLRLGKRRESVNLVLALKQFVPLDSILHIPPTLFGCAEGGDLEQWANRVVGGS